MAQIKTETLSQRFEVAYNKIDEVVKKWVNYHDRRFTVLLREGAKHHHLLKKYQEELEQYGKLRNAIVHEKRELGFYIAEPHQEVVERIELIAKILGQPNYALTIASKDVICFDAEDSVVKAIQAIKKHPYSQYPVYQGKTCIGLLTTGDIVRWMAEHVINTIVDLTDIKVVEILETVVEHPIVFAAKSIDIFEVEEIYEIAHKEKTDLEVVIITENGNENEVPLGLITAWDIIEIDYSAD